MWYIFAKNKCLYPHNDVNDCELLCIFLILNTQINFLFKITFSRQVNSFFDTFIAQKEYTKAAVLPATLMKRPR
jgi:hypothetical protein